MKTRFKIMSVFGTRPEAIKMAPLVKEIEKKSEVFESIVAVTAQHREMLDQVLEIFNISPDYDLNIMKANQSLAQITTRSLEGLDRIIQEKNPDLILVHGDTTTTFAASLAAVYNKIPLGHVEAGLRTWNKYSPFPEELNRQLTGLMADLHFAPTKKAKENLLNENKKDQQIIVTGNTAIDALKTTVNSNYEHPILKEAKSNEKDIILVTAHRRENLGENMNQIFKAIKRLVENNNNIQVIYPVHLNPKIQSAANEILGNDKRIKLIDPLGVIDFHNFAANAKLILTDSGGVQEEAPSLGVPVLVLRKTTERPEGIEAGTLKLIGTNEEFIYENANELLSNSKKYSIMSKASNPYGDGEASKYIVNAIIEYFDL